MSPDSSPQPPLLDADSARLLDEFALCQAAELARRGAFDGAESLLQPLLKRTDASLTAMDLQARICAQQGRLQEAARWWQKVLDRDPTHAAAQAGLARLNRMQRRPVALQMAWPLIVGALVLVGVSCLAVRQARHRAAAEARLQETMAESFRAELQTARQTLLTAVHEIESHQPLISNSLATLVNSRVELAPLMAQMSNLDVQVRELNARQSAFAASLTNQAGSLFSALGTSVAAATNQFGRLLAQLFKETETRAAVLEAEMGAFSNQLVFLEKVSGQHTTQQDHQASQRGGSRNPMNGPGPEPPPASILDAFDGIQTSQAAGCLVVRFENGLFDHGTHFKPGARVLLERLARKIAASQPALRVEVAGHADDDRTFLKWTAAWESSLALERATAVVSYWIGLGVLDPKNLSAVSGSQRPYPSVSEKQRARNRTVVLRISHAL